MGSEHRKSDDIRASAERMRRDGKTFPEISRALGIALGTVHAWAKAGGWPDPRDAKRVTKAAVKQAVAAAFDPSIELDPALFLPDRLEKIAENVIRYTLKALLAIPTGANLKAALDASTRIYLAKEEEKQIRQFQVMLPPTTEVYGGDQAPDRKKK